MNRERSARQGFLGGDSDKTLNSVRVGIAGLGGGGSHIAQQLAHVGAGQVRLFDPQSIDATNLNRLIGGTRADVYAQTPKVEIAGRLMRSVDPGISIIEVNDRWQQSPELLQACDFIFGCVDSFGERNQLERLARRFLIPYVDVGMDVHNVGGVFVISGQVALSLPDSACLWCMGLLTEVRLEEEARNYGAAGGKPQVVWPNGILASTAIGIFANVLFPWQGKADPPLLLEYDGNRHSLAESNKIPMLRKMICRHHDGKVGDLFWKQQVLAVASAPH